MEILIRRFLIVASNADGSADVTDYINGFEGTTKERLEELRIILLDLVPEIEEKISYNIPALRTGKYLTYYAGYKNYISMYPINPMDYEFSEELKLYASGKATLRFPNEQPLPAELITKLIKTKL